MPKPEDTAVINFDTVGTVNTWSQNATTLARSTLRS